MTLFAQAEKKVNLGIGAYRDESGKPWVLECVKAVSCISAFFAAPNRTHLLYHTYWRSWSVGDLHLRLLLCMYLKMNG
jgi:hypothetical protein